MIARQKRRFRAADLFCGGGGMTLGAEMSRRVRVLLAINHWRIAIDTHSANHPKTRHICTRIEDMNLRDRADGLPEIDLLMGGIECTHHSNARGATPIDDQRRTSAWRVIDWIERFQPAWCVFENVREFLKWGPITDGRRIKERAGEIFNSWVAAIRAHGYYVEWKVLDSAQYGEATRRLRLFIVCRRGESQQPFEWPSPTHGSAETIARQLAENGKCNLELEVAAAAKIDWSDLGTSIFARKKPLADKTLRRIEIGIQKFVAPFITPHFGERDGQTPRTHDLGKPLPTVTGQGAGSLVTPFLMDLHNQRRDDNTSAADEPLPVIVGKPGNSVIAPFILPREGFYRGNKSRSVGDPFHTIVGGRDSGHLVSPLIVQTRGPGYSSMQDRVYDIRRPLPTLTGDLRHGLASPFLLAVNHGDEKGDKGQRVYDVGDPLRTITSSQSEALVWAFLTKYYGTAGAAAITQPLGTLTTKSRYALTLVQTMQKLGIVDVFFRMLQVEELAAAQGFPDSYIFKGNKADRVRQIGNSVCPRVMRAICEQLD